MIFISAIQVSDLDRLRGYAMGAVDYVPVPVIPEVLRAKIRVFAELYRKTRQLEKLNRELETRVSERTAALEFSFLLSIPTMAVATGSTPVSTHFDVPNTVETGASTLVVVANGIPSAPVSVTIN